MKKLLSLLLVLVTLLGIIPTSAFAADSVEAALGEVDIYNGGYELGYLSINGAVKKQDYTYFMYKGNDGTTREVPAYCVNPYIKGVPQKVEPGQSIKYLAEERSSDPKVVGIISNGYPHRSLGELNLDDKYQAYYATKMALWCYLLSTWDINNLKVAPGLSGSELDIGNRILAAAKDIYKRGTTYNYMLTPKMTATPDHSVAYPVRVDGKDYYQQVFTVWSETWVYDYDISVAFQDPSAVPDGTRIVNMDNQDVTAVAAEGTGDGYSAQFKVLYPAESIQDQSGSVQLALSAAVAQYAAMYAVCQEKDKYGDLQNYICDLDNNVRLDVAAISNYYDGQDPDPDETALKIVKLEEGTKIPLEGAVFSVYDPEGRKVGSFSTGPDGTVVIPLTLEGHYTVTEEIPPRYHLLPEERTQHADVEYNKTATLTFTMGSTAKTAVKERGVPVKSSGHPIRQTAGIGKPGWRPPVRAFPARQARRAAEAGARLARTQKAARVARMTARQAAQAANRALRAVIAAAKALAAAATAGGGVVIAVVVVICLCGIILASPLGIFFAGPDETTGAVSPAQAVAQINGELGEKISSMQVEGGYDTLEIQGQPPPWSDILAVFAAKTAGASDGTTVAILDSANVEALRTVFWDMTKLTSTPSEVEHPASGDTPAWTEKILTVTITARTPDDMRVFYSFTEEQNAALDELLANSDMLAALAGDLTISDATAKKLLADLPADLDPERRAVVETACRLVGKVSYFWGGKSLVIGWDSRWGQLTKVWADGSSTTGTYRPYGLDCSGFVDWVFYNVTDGEYVIGHGGGAHMQHTYCTLISWDEAQPGDLVFYPGDEHVGIVGGRDESGNMLIIHCAFSQNNVVITGLEGFTSIGHPLYYGE